ncbi:hypothetical protein HK405_006111, partial [Cladochytrium tenue]
MAAVDAERKMHAEAARRESGTASVPSANGAATARHEDVSDIALSSVDGETMADAIGVHLDAARLILRISEGDLEMLQTALSYTSFCTELLSNHRVALADSLSNDTLAGLELRTLQIHGVVHAEMALDVPNSDDRKRLQVRALELLRTSVACASGTDDASADADATEKNGSQKGLVVPPELSFHLAMQLAEVGEISLLLTAAAVFRAEARWTAARAATAEAERLVEACAVVDAQARSRESLVCRSETFDDGMPKVAAKTYTVPAPKASTASRKSSRSTTATPRELDADAQWGGAPPVIRRMIADVMFEDCLTSEAEYRHAQDAAARRTAARGRSAAGSRAGSSRLGSLADQLVPGSNPSYNLFGDLMPDRRGSGFSSVASVVRSTQSVPLWLRPSVSASGLDALSLGSGPAAVASEMSPVPTGHDLARAASPAATRASHGTSVNGGQSPAAAAATAAVGASRPESLGSGGARQREISVAADELAGLSPTGASAATADAARSLARLMLDLQRVTVVDDEHMAARVLLGALHLERAALSQPPSTRPNASDPSAATAAATDVAAYTGALFGTSGATPAAGLSGPAAAAPSRAADLAAAEFWLERACRRGRGRGGSGGGSAGAGEAPGLEGWRAAAAAGGPAAWAGLGRALAAAAAAGTRSPDAAAECLLYAAELERVACGGECDDDDASSPSPLPLLPPLPPLPDPTISRALWPPSSPGYGLLAPLLVADLLDHA